MFSLIITIISIALVAALALATLYYGGSAFNRGSASAEAARLINEGQQVNGAVAIAQADAAAGGTVSATWGDLVTNQYMSQLPANLGLTGAAAIADIAKIGLSADVCGEVQKRATGSEAVIADADGSGQVYGCTTVGSDETAVRTFFFKV